MTEEQYQKLLEHLTNCIERLNRIEGHLLRQGFGQAPEPAAREWVPQHYVLDDGN